jgi:hypothetical protein
LRNAIYPNGIDVALHASRRQKPQIEKSGVIGDFGSPLCSAAFWPTHLKVKVIEVGIIQIASMPNDAAGWQRSHFNLLAILDNVAERLKFD